MRMTKDYLGAFQEYSKIINKYHDFRLIGEAYLGAMSSAIDRSEPSLDDAQMVLEAAIGNESRVGEQIVKKLKLEQLAIYIKSENYADALPRYEALAADKDEVIAVQGIRGVLGCKRKQGDTDLPAYCRGLIERSGSKRVKMIAAVGLGEVMRRKAQSLKDFREAVEFLADAVVVYYPGRGSGLEPDHEEALFHLAGCYESMAAQAKAPAVTVYLNMARQTYKEVLAVYGQSNRAQEAGTALSVVEAKLAEAGPAAKGANP